MSSTVCDTPESIAFFRLAALKGAVGLELKGLKLSRGRSAVAIAKQQYGLKGSHPSIYQQLCAMVEKAIAEKGNNGTASNGR